MWDLMHPIGTGKEDSVLTRLLSHQKVFFGRRSWIKAVMGLKAHLSTPETKWHSSRIEQTNCHWFYMAICPLSLRWTQIHFWCRYPFRKMPFPVAKFFFHTHANFSQNLPKWSLLNIAQVSVRIRTPVWHFRFWGLGPPDPHLGPNLGWGVWCWSNQHWRSTALHWGNFRQTFSEEMMNNLSSFELATAFSMVQTSLQVHFLLNNYGMI